MTEVRQATFDGWAIVDVLGHQRYVGYVTTEAFGQAVLFRIDVPRLEPRERTTKRPGYGPDGRYLPVGTVIAEGAVESYTKLVGSGSIYTITPCTKDAALQAVEDMQTRPLMEVRLPPESTLPAAVAAEAAGDPGDRDADDDDDEDDGDDDRDDDDGEGEDDEDEDEDELQVGER
jgi:hypothetical protein